VINTSQKCAWMVLPTKIEFGLQKQQKQTKQWHRQDDGGKGHSRRRARGLRHLNPAAQLGTGGFRRLQPILRQRRTPPA
jgi:hypothetical protein